MQNLLKDYAFTEPMHLQRLSICAKTTQQQKHRTTCHTTATPQLVIPSDARNLLFLVVLETLAR
jgi:hypothetical protein